jgi:hypothetical protein
MATCGVWMTARRLVAVAVDDEGLVLARAIAVPREDDARWDLVARVEAEHGLDVAFVVTETMLATDALPRMAMQRGAYVRVAPDELVDFASRLVGPLRLTPVRLATLLARLPLAPPFAARLSRVELQLPLL